MTSSLGLSTKKALTILRDQLSALLEGHQKERKKVTSWKVRHQTAQGWVLSLPFSKQSWGLSGSWLHSLPVYCCRVSGCRNAKVHGTKARNYLRVYFSQCFSPDGWSSTGAQLQLWRIQGLQEPLAAVCTGEPYQVERKGCGTQQSPLVPHVIWHVHWIQSAGVYSHFLNVKSVSLWVSDNGAAWHRSLFILPSKSKDESVHRDSPIEQCLVL